jgi:tellurite resistance protein TehA-like permease
MFGISPSDLPWWGWFLCAVGAGIISHMSGNAAEDKAYFNDLLFYAFGIGAIICVLMAILCLVKLQWGD